MTTNRRIVRRGEIYWLDWSAGRGSEQSGRRPAVVVQEDSASGNPNYPLTIVAAVSTRGRTIAAHVEIAPTPTNGLAAQSFVKCEQLQTVSKDRLGAMIGTLDDGDLSRVDVSLRTILGF